MRVGIIAFLQESNTFIDGVTVRRHFEEDLLIQGEAIRLRMAASAHEVGGFFAALEAESIEAVPIFAARAYPFGVIEAATFDTLVGELLDAFACRRSAGWGVGRAPWGHRGGKSCRCRRPLAGCGASRNRPSCALDRHP
jgi:hypothetical protein